MKKIVSRLIVIAALLGSCTKEELGGAFDNQLPKGKVRLTLQTDRGGFSTPVKTRAGVADEERMGGNVWAFMLERSEASSPDYTLKSVEKVGIKQGGAIELIADQTTNPMKVILLANAPDRYVDKSGAEQDFTFANLSHITSYSELKQTLNTAALGSPALSVPYTPGGLIPMSGQVDFPSGIGASSIINLSLKRIVAKITVETAIPSAQFELLGASVCNAPTSGWLLPPVTLWRDNSAHLTHYQYDAIGCTATQVDSKQTTASNPIYIYESRPEEQTAIVIKATYQGNTYFYKLAMAADYSVVGGADTQVKPKNFYCRNFTYTYIVTSVTGGGYATFQEACHGAPSNNIQSVLDVIDLTSHDLIDNGAYFLGVSNSLYVIYATGSRSNLIAVTLSTGGDPDWSFTGTVTASEGMTITQGATFNYPVAGREVAVSVADHFSTGKLTIKVGNLTKTIDVRRAYTAPFDGPTISAFGTSDYVVGVIESVSNSSAGDWIGLSPSANGVDLGRRTIVNNNGGIHIRMGVNGDQTNGVAGRNATLYLSRKTDEGRVKVYLEQDYTTSRNI